MNCVFDNDRPIYIQLVDKIRTEIISGRLKPNERLPSVREIAVTVKVNPNTVQKALSELENERLIYTERTNGKYVTNDSNLILKIKKDIADENVKTFLEDMKNIGITYEETLKYLKDIGGIK